MQQAVEFGTAAVNAAVSVINIYVVDLPVTLAAVVAQHILLIDYALTGIASELVLVLDGQTTVYSNFRH